MVFQIIEISLKLKFSNSPNYLPMELFAVENSTKSFVRVYVPASASDTIVTVYRHMLFH